MLKDTQQQKQFRILLIGETCLDVYNTGAVERISPEAPVPVLKKTRSKTSKKTKFRFAIKNQINTI